VKPAHPLTLKEGHTLPMSYAKTLLLLIDDSIGHIVLMTPSVISVDDVFHSIELVRVLIEVALCVGHRGRLEHLVQLLVILMELFLLISFHPHAEGVQSRESLLTLDAIVDMNVFPLKRLNLIDYIDNVKHFPEQDFIVLVYQSLPNLINTMFAYFFFSKGLRVLGELKPD
jgi:hypothetical protein